MTHTFENIKNKLINELPEIVGEVEAFLVCTIHAKFSLYLVNANAQLIKVINDKYNNELTIIEKIKTNDFIHERLKEQEKVNIKNGLYYVDRAIDKVNWFIEKERFNSKSKIAAFYSFKGGLGRTTALVLSALYLARQGEKVVLIDLDIEAPGLGSLFLSDKDFAHQASNKGVVDFMLDLLVNNNDKTKIDINDYYFTINQQSLVGKKGGELCIFPAANFSISDNNTNYIDKLSKINFQYSSDSLYAPDILIELIDDILEPDYILLDTRTGINDIGGVVFNRYAEAAFLFFYGNQQNMFGLESVLQKISNLPIQYYLINSPVPKEFEEEEKNFYIESSYQIFIDNVYDELSIPDINDETSLHYPINIPYNDVASFLNNTNKLKYLLEQKGADNPYIKIANLLQDKSSYNNSNYNRLASVIVKDDLVKAISKIIEGTAASDEEFKSENDLKKKFYPRKDYRYIFDKNKFLILGEKGSGKTALFAVLSQPQYAKSLASYCESHSQESQRTTWIKGLDTTAEFPTSVNFRTLKDLSDNHLRNYWLYLMFRQIPDSLWGGNIPESIIELKQMQLSDLRKKASEDLFAEEIEEKLSQLNHLLKINDQYLTIVYDYFDRLLTEDDNLRGRLVGALLGLWYDYLNRLPNIRAKIFLRMDIYNREIPTGVTDKVKLNNFKQEIEWDYTQLLNMVWKRIIEENPEATINFFENANLAIVDPVPQLGYIPDYNEEEHRLLLEKLLGRRMGSNNKAFPYNWIIQHIADTNKHIQPRSMLNLFGLAGQKQLLDDTPAIDILRPANMEHVLGEVSQNRVRDLTEEYPDLAPVLLSLSRYLNQFPAYESNLIQALNEIIEIEDLNLKEKPETLIDKLIDMGVLYEYQFKRTNEEKRYHIPDLYLFGLGLRRRGPGAQKALFDKFRSRGRSKN